MTELLSVEELAGKIKFNKKTIYRWVKGGNIPYVKMPSNDIRFDENKIENWLENRSVNKKALRDHKALNAIQITK